MAIGKISGPMLYNNLERQGVDLAIEANVLYVDVTNRRVGANTATPNADLQVVGTANIADITISSNSISSITGAVNFGSNANITISGGEIGRVLTSDGYGSVTWELVSTLATGFGNVTIDDNNISSTTQDGNLELNANGNGVVTTTTYNFYAANVYTANVNAEFINGNVRANDIISTGNITAPWFVGNLDGTTVTTTGNVTAPYFVGNVEGNVYGNVTAVTVDATGNVTAPWFVGNVDSTTVTATGNITAPYFVGNVEGNVAGNLVGNVTATTITSGNVDANFFNGNIRANDIISTGNITAPWFIGNVEGTTVTTTGNITGPYFVGNVEGNVNGNVTAVTVDATGNITAPWFVGNVDSTTVTATGNITAPYFVGNLVGNVEGNVAATSVVATGNIDAGFFNGNLRANDIIVGNVISGDSYISSAQVKLQDINISGNVISSLTTDLVFSANVTDPNNIIRFDSVSALDIASGTTAQRPPNPDPGYVRYNTDITTVEWWNGTEWTAGSRLIEAETITPDGINQTFTLGQSTLPEGILVNINGTIQQAMSGAYTVAGDQITFSEIPEITDIIEIRYLSAGMTSASWYGGTIVNPVHITAMTPTTSATTGALTVHGGVGFGSNLTIAGNIIPAANTAYSLGDADHWWKSLYVSSNTIYINGIPLSVQADGTLLVNNAPVLASGSTYANSNVAAYLTSQDITGANIGTLFNGNASTQANLGAFQLYANANVGLLYNGNIATNANLGAYQTYANLSIGELQANLGSTQTWANANIASINANVGSFYTWANTNFGTSSYSNTNTAAYLVANPQSGTYSNTNVAAYLTTQTFYSNINVDAYIGANIGTLYNGNASTNANLGAFQTWANANAAGLSNQITGANAVVSMLQANVGSFYTWANNNFGTSSYSNANVSAYLVANPQGSTYSNTNVAAYLVANPQGSTYSNTNVEAYIGANVGAYQTYANANAATQATSINSLATGANANTAAYLATATITTTGNITAGNIITSGATSGNITDVNVISANSLQLNANLTVSGNGTIGTNLFVYGNLQVSGTTTTVNQATLSVTDKIITVANGSTNGTQANGAGLSVAGANANIVYTSVGDQWNSNKPFYATALYDNSVRVVSTSSGAGNLTVTAGAVNLTAVGPGAVTTGSATAIPVITTDAYGRISAITTAAVSSTLNTAGNTGTGTINLTSQSLTIAGTNGITAVASGQTVTVTDNLWPAANANIGTLFNGNISTNSNLGAFQLYANANIGTLFNGNITTNANLGAFQTYANSNAATQATSINTINANVGAYQIYANANIGILFNGNISTNANLGAFQLYANANIGTLYNGNISTNANLGAYQVWANANAATQQTSITSLATNANTNTAAYLAAGISTNLTTTGNVSATNVIVNGQPTTYGTVNPDYITAGRITSDQTGAGAGSDIIFNYAPVSSGITLNTSTGVFTLTAGKTYQLFAELSFSNFSDTANGYEIYDWVDATTNTRLSTTGIGAGIGENINRNTNEFNATSTTLIYTPTTNQTVKVRIVEAAGTVTVRAGIGTKAIIQQINPTIAVQATATGTVNNQYSGVTLTSNQVIGSPGTPTNIVFQSATGTVPYNTSTGVWTLTSGVTYNLTAVLAVTGASNYLGYQWVDSVSGTALSTALGFATLATTQVSSVPLSIVYTPNTNQTIALRNVNGQYASVIANYSWATVTQINQAFALNALDTMSTTGNVTVGGNLNVTGTSTSLITKVSGFVNAGTFVTIDNIKATVTTSGQRGLSLATVSGTATCYISGTYGMYGGATVGGASAGFSMTTTASASIFSWSFGSEGDTATYILNYGYTKSYRITMMIGGGYNNNMITIERLI